MFEIERHIVEYSEYVKHLGVKVDAQLKLYKPIYIYTLKEKSCYIRSSFVLTISRGPYFNLHMMMYHCNKMLPSYLLAG